MFLIEPRHLHFHHLDVELLFDICELDAGVVGDVLVEQAEGLVTGVSG